MTTALRKYCTRKRTDLLTKDRKPVFRACYPNYHDLAVGGSAGGIRRVGWGGAEEMSGLGMLLCMSVSTASHSSSGSSPAGDSNSCPPSKD